MMPTLRHLNALAILAAIVAGPALADGSDAQKSKRINEQSHVKIDRTITGSTPKADEMEQPKQSYPPSPSSIGGNVFF